MPFDKPSASSISATWQSIFWLRERRVQVDRLSRAYSQACKDEDWDQEQRIAQEVEDLVNRTRRP